MNRIVTKSKISSDGVLHLSLPVGLESAEQEVQITVEPCGPPSILIQEKLAEWVDSLAGTWQGDFASLSDIHPDRDASD